MFGQPSPFGGNNSVGGTTTATPFGASSNTTPAFGTTAPAPAFGGGGFGSGGGFGAPAPAPSTGFGGFGSTPAASAPSTGFGGFGTSTTAASTTSAFGSTSAISNTPFGAPAAAAPSSVGLFGGGAPAAAPSTGGLFGGGTSTFGSTPAPSTGFGGGSAFGAPAPSAFGATTTTTSAFGAPPPAPSTGLFGAPAPSAFGSPAPASGGMFGAPAPAPFGASAPASGGGLFGSTAANTNTNGKGSLAVPYQVTNKNDNNITISLQAISAMPAYETKSLEEIRLEDYLNGNKGSQGQPAANTNTGFGAGGFGTTSTFGSPAPAPTGGLFGGAAPAPSAFGAPAPATGGLFGSSTPAPASAFGAAPAPAFGSPAPAPAFGGFGTTPAPAAGAFGSPAPATGGLFGGGAAAPAPATGGLFGSAPTPATGGLFGSTAPTPAPATGGLFGTTPAAAPATGGLFGAPAPATGGGLFGGAPAAPASAGGGLFGAKPATGGLFGAAPTPAPATGGLFGTAAPVAPATGGLFGGTAPAPAAGGGLFGAPAPAPAAGGLFGAPAKAPTTGGLFGAPAPAAGGLFGAAAPATGGLFGAPAPASAGGGLFGAPAPAAVTATTTPASSTMLMPPSADVLLAQQLAAVQNQKKELALLDAWRGNPPNSSSTVVPLSNNHSPSNTNSNSNNSNNSAVMASLLSYQAGPRSAVKIRPRAFGNKSSSTSSAVASSLGRKGSQAPSSLLSPNSFLWSSAKKLVIKPGSLTPKPNKLRLLLDNQNNDSSETTRTTPSSHQQPLNTPISITNHPNPKDTPTMLENTLLLNNGATKSPFLSPNVHQSKQQQQQQSNIESTQNRDNFDNAKSLSNGLLANNDMASPEYKNHSSSDKSNGTAYDFYKQVIESKDDNSASPQECDDSNDQLPKLTKEGYEMFPSSEDLKNKNLTSVSNFEIKRDGIGSICWDGAVDIQGIDLDAAICIEPKDVAVYDEAEAAGNKPPVGTKLNRPAVITMYGIWPKLGSNSSYESRQKFEKKIAKQTKKMDAQLLTYDSKTGIWKFRVQHFSRYGLFDDDSDDDDNKDNMQEVNPPLPKSEAMDFKLGGRGGRLPGARNLGRSRIQAPVEEEDDGDGDDTDMSSMDDDDVAALTNDNDEITEKSEDALMKAAENAYKVVIDTCNTQEHQFKADFSTTNNTEDGAYQFSDVHALSIPDEGEIISQYNRPIVTLEQNSDVGHKPYFKFCAKLAARVGMKKTTSSNTDLGMRMGRSFRVAWRPDGSLLIPQKQRSNTELPSSLYQSSVLVQYRPIICKNDISNDSNKSFDSLPKNSLTLLSNHFNHSIPTKQFDDDCPIFQLPRNNSSTYITILKDLARAAKGESTESKDNFYLSSSVLSSAFELMSTLETGYNISKDSQYHKKVVLRWIRDTVKQDVDKDISLANTRKDKYAAVLAALTGLDISNASSIAMKYDALRLSLIISSSDPQKKNDFCNQIEHWEDTNSFNLIPQNLLRIYCLLSGNLDLEENLFRKGSNQESTLDWKRRFGMMLWCADCQSNDGKNDGAFMTSIISDYENSINDGLAPPPLTWYDKAKKNKDICLLFKLLKLLTLSKEKQYLLNETLSNAISPPGLTSSCHDFSGTFHLAAATSMLDISVTLTAEEEMRLIDGYSSQLISAGMWEWAVFVNLCCIRTSGKDLKELKKDNAKKIILRYSRANSSNASKREFLEKNLGVPSIWFEMATAYNFIYMSDSYGYVKHAVRYSTKDAIKTYNATILPLMLFQGGINEHEKVLGFVDAINNEEENGDFTEDLGICFVANEYLKLSRTVLEISHLSEVQWIQQKDSIEDLLVQANEIENLVFNMDKFGGSGETGIQPRQSIPSFVSLTELISCLSLLKTQIKSILAGNSIIDRGRMNANVYGGLKMKYSSQMALHCSHDSEFSFEYTHNLMNSSNLLQANHCIQ